MTRKFTKLVGVLALTLTLAGCAEPNKLLPPDSLYPSTLTSCLDEPKVVARADKTKSRPDTVKAKYIAGLRGAYLDCHDDISEWAKRRELYVKQYNTTNYNYFQRVWRSVTNQKDQP